MKVIAVASPGSRSGKTLVITRLLETFPGMFTAVKFTHAHNAVPAASAECSCRLAESPFIVQEDPAVLDVPGKDTTRFLAAGARRVLLCVAPSGQEHAAWSHLARQHLGASEIVVVEGNRAAAAAGPDLLFFVVNPEKPRNEWKQGIEELMDAADAVLWNGPQPAAAPFPRAPRRFMCGDLTLALRESFPEAVSLVAGLIARPGV